MKAIEYSIFKKLEKIKLDYERKYGAAIFDVEAKISKNGHIILEGRVLSEIQKAEAESAVNKSGIGRIKNNIKVLCDPKEKAETGWGIIKPDIADMISVFPGRRRKKFRSDKFRAAQLEKNDAARILAEKGSYLLAQKNDLTIGWIKKSQISRLADKTRNSKRGWRNAKRAMQGKALKIRRPEDVRKRFISFLKRYLAIPYLWGGTTSKGMDCSGLAQKFYEEIFGIILPKHSRDQALCGKKIDLKSARFGDLIFLRHKKKNFPHIGIVAEAVDYRESPANCLQEIWILNARKEQGKAATEDLSAILKTYKLISVKKIL